MENKHMFWNSLRLSAAVGYLLVAASSCSKAEPDGVPPRALADAVHAVIEADRTTYAQKVVTRLQDEQGVIRATEHWQDEKTLPLPAQMLRMGAESAAKSGAKFSYALISLWPVNKKNAAKTEIERTGLKTVAANPKQPFYGEENLGGRRYLTAVYADAAVAPACVTCHNEHRDSPRKDFKLGDVMGGIVVRVPLDDAL
jgi:hypothetical protein